MREASALVEVLEALAARHECAEVYAKTGWSRRFDLENGVEGAVSSRESGWSARAGDSRSSFFFASAGAPRLDCELPSPTPGGLRLPPSEPAGKWEEDDTVSTPLLGELEGRRLVRALASTLEAEAPNAWLRLVILEDGASDVEVASSTGVEASFRNRLATLRMQAIEPETGGQAEIYVAGRCAHDFRAQATARRIADLLFIAREGRSVSEAGVRALLSPEVATAILDSMSPLFVQSDSSPRWLRPGNEVAGSAVTVIDDGRCLVGLVRSPVDGEGVPTGPLALIDRGCVGEPIRPWWSPERSPSAALRGCRLRAGWRDLPRTGSTHLYFDPSPDVSVASLLSAVERGYYLIDALGPCSLDPESGSFSLPCCGFEVERGRAAGPIHDVRLEGRLQGFLKGLRAVARDLTFLPRTSIVGSPSILVEGLDLRGGSGAPFPPSLAFS